jgi:hypothetical protein
LAILDDIKKPPLNPDVGDKQPPSSRWSLKNPRSLSCVIYERISHLFVIIYL